MRQDRQLNPLEAHSRRRFLQTAGAAGVGLVLPGVLAACGGGSGTTTSGVAPTDTTSTQDIVRGGTLTVAAAYAATSLDPYSFDGQDVPFFTGVLRGVYETLVVPNTTFTEWEPLLATKWEASADGLTYTFTIRDGVAFHDGQPLTAKDIVWSIDQTRSKPNRFASALALVDAVQVRGNTVVLRLKSPDNLLLAALWYVFVSRAGTSATAAKQKMNGTGPFKLQGWDQGQQKITVARNDAYWRDGLPYLDSVVAMAVPDGTVRAQQLIAGQASWVVCDFNQIQPVKNAGMVLPPPVAPDGTATGLSFLYVNNASGPLGDIRVRQAMSYAIDRQALSRALFELMKPFSNPIPRDSELFDASAPSYDAVDVDRAKQLLSEAGYGDGVSVGSLMTYPGGAQIVNLPQLIQQQLAAAGIEIKLETVQVAEWVKRVTETGKFDLAFASVPVNIPVVQTTLGEVWGPPRTQWSGWKGVDQKEFYGALEQMYRQSGDGLGQAVRSMQAIAMREQPNILLGTGTDQDARSEQVHGAPNTMYLGGIDPAKVWIAKA